MKVYVLEAGSYDERWIVGVFSSAAAARAAWNPARSEYATVGEYEVEGNVMHDQGENRLGRAGPPAETRD